MLNAADRERIAAAVGAAEAKTSGEILCVLSHKVSDYREIPLAWAAGAAMVLPAVATAFGAETWLLAQVGGDWVAANGVSQDTAVRLALTLYGVAQIVIFAAVAVLLAAITPLKMMLTPKGLKHLRVRRAAMHHLTATRMLGADAAIVIFASEAERMVTVVADEAIHLKAGDAAWDAAVSAVLSGIRSGDAAAGFIAAIEVCGGYMADHFPATGERRNAVPDGLLEI
jgi:putative membrane protein